MTIAATSDDHLRQLPQPADIAARLDAHLQPCGRAKVSGFGYLCADFADGFN